MNCPDCGDERTRVVDTETSTDRMAVRRHAAARAGADTAGEACPSGLRRLPSGVAGLRRVPTWQSEQD